MTTPYTSHRDQPLLWLQHTLVSDLKKYKVYVGGSGTKPLSSLVFLPPRHHLLRILIGLTSRLLLTIQRPH